ncbi:MAG: hypothetical protein M5U14_10725 [Acidimicrobiia bacterium]|nr:hypothetical protein [Acidimicrobiia bacterium]
MDLIGAVSWGDFYADSWRIVLSFGLLVAYARFWWWLFSNLGTF